MQIDIDLPMIDNSIRKSGPSAPFFSSGERKKLNARFEHANPIEILQWAWETFGSEVVMGTGFGQSGIVLLHQMSQAVLSIPVFYLDTGLLFDETYDLRDKLETVFNLSFIRVSTDLTLDEQANQYVPELWKINPNKCCFLRKVLPLQNFLKDKTGWITGVRRHQSSSRSQTDVIEWDHMNEVVKINPLAHWNADQIWDYIDENDLPYNPLHDFGYPSIGCWPCTDPVKPGEDERAGRWKGKGKIECGIHLPTQNQENR